MPLAGGTFTPIFEWVIRNGYFILFLGMIVEGPTITAAASFAVTMGYFNLAAVFILAVLGDIVGDFIWYGLGYFGRLTVIKKYGHFFGATDQRMEKLKHLLERHPGKILLAIKLSPFLPVPGLIVTGSTHMPPKKFFTVIFAIILPKTILFMGLGYFFGQAYDKISIYVNNSIYAIGALLVLTFVFNYIYKKTTGSISKTLGV